MSCVKKYIYDFKQCIIDELKPPSSSLKCFNDDDGVLFKMHRKDKKC